MSDGPLFPKKSETNEEPTTGSQVVIERSDDASTSTGGSSGNGLPTVQSRKIGCGSAAFGLLMVAVAMVVGRVLI